MCIWKQAFEFISLLTQFIFVYFIQNVTQSLKDKHASILPVQMLNCIKISDLFYIHLYKETKLK